MTTDPQMSLVDHLGELRRRMIYCFVAAFAGMLAAYSLYNPWLLNFIRGPLDTLAGRTENPFVFYNPLLGFLQSSAPAMNLNLHFIGPMEVFLIKLRVSFFAGLILTSPFILYQIWKFVGVGLIEKERRAIRVFLPSSLILFLCGILTAYLIMLPVVLYFLVVVSGEGLEPTLILSKYASLIVVCCITMGLVFQTPLIILFLTSLGIVSPSFLISKRKYAILLIFIIAAVLTPPDVVTQVMMALPMMVLYEAGIWLSKVVWARRGRNLDEQALPRGMDR